jgi:hypothetical protein
VSNWFWPFGVLGCNSSKHHSSIKSPSILVHLAPSEFDSIDSS